VLNFAELYENHAQDVFSFALWLTADPTVAADITSETFVLAWGRRADVRTETLRAYLLMIARNAYLKHQRDRKRQVPLHDVHVDPAPSPEQRADANLRLQRVREFLATLPEADRSAFVLRVQQDLPYAEIARVLGLSLSAAKVKVHRVRKSLLLHFAAREES
jgi:RNA polymerase sigma-70 factor (ECF subfamily)